MDLVLRKSPIQNGSGDFFSRSRPASSGQLFLVAVVTGIVTILECHAKIAPVELAIAITRVVILGGSLVGAGVLEFVAPVLPAIVAAFLDAFIVPCVQG